MFLPIFWKKKNKILWQEDIFQLCQKSAKTEVYFLLLVH